MTSSSTEALYNLLQSEIYCEVKQRTYLALDVPNGAEALSLVEQFGDIVDGYKVGLQLFHAAGHQVIDALLHKGKRVFLDVKLHDIPNTVAGALKAICDFPIEMVNVHTLGGLTMMQRAREAVDHAHYHPLLIGVTILTSMSHDDLLGVGIDSMPTSQVQRLAKLADDAMLDGIVASAQELDMIQKTIRRPFVTVIPGTRPKGSALHDQKRTMTPGEAIRLGASHLVLGRAVLKATNPLLALQEIWDDMRAQLAQNIEALENER